MAQRVGRYLLLEKIGQGGMAEVFEARLEGPQQFQRTCVIKRLRPELLQMPQQVELFLEEARLTALLQHPNLVQVFDLGEADGQYFFAMERVDGPPLSRLMDVLAAAMEPMPMPIAVFVAARVAEALHFAHDVVDRVTGRPLHIVHRDVSPQNILLGMQGDVKVADFGIAKAAVEHRPQTQAGITKGKLAYMSPEQARGATVDRRTDVYALGVVLWEMLTGQPLFSDRAQRRRLEKAKVPPPSSVRSDVDATLDEIVERALESQAKDRTPTARHVEEALDRWLADHHALAPRATLQRLLQTRSGAFIAMEQTSPFNRIAPTGSGFSIGAVGPLGPASPQSSSVSPDAPTRVRPMPTSPFDDDSLASGISEETTRPNARAFAQPSDVGEAPTAPRGVPAPQLAPPLTTKAPVGHIPVKAGRAAIPLPQVPSAGASLPHATTSFIGRTQELARIEHELDEGARIVTLVGPGGTGKTRLALKLAEDAVARRSFPGGVWFCDLVGARDAATALSTIARALGVPLRSGRTPLEAQVNLGHALGALGRALLVLDNCDEIAGRHADVIADLARRAPRTRLLITSQQLLGVNGERVVDVAPLAVPSVDTPVAGAAHDDPAHSDAVELFLDRARTARGGRALSDAARGVVSEIVRRLDGVPLAIELAAARASTESPSEILARLPRTRDVRTLRAAIGDTYRNLAADEQRAFRQASVFRGGFDLEAADAVLELDDNTNARDILERLKGRSLLTMRTEGAPERSSTATVRYSMLEVLRAFATERLEEANERTTTEARHAGHYVSLGKQLRSAIERHDDDADRKVSREAENLAMIIERASLAARPSTAAATIAIEAALALEPVLTQRASAIEQLDLLDKALTLAEGRGVNEALLMRAHLARGEARRLLGSFDAARADLNAAIDLASHAGDATAEGRALASLGSLALAQGKHGQAEDLLSRAFALAERAAPPDDVTAARVLTTLAKVSRLRRALDDAEDRCKRAIERARKSGDKRDEGRALVELGSTLLARRRNDDAARAADEAVRILQARNDRRSLVHAWGTLSIIELDRGRFDEAEAAAARAVELATFVGERRAEGLYLGIRGAALHGRGALLEARDLYAHASRVLLDVGDEGHGGFFLGALGAVQAALDDIPAGEQAFKLAARRLRTAERPLLHLSVGVFEALLGIARAGDEPTRRDARAELARRIESATASSSSSSTGGASPAEQSEEVRFAVRIARAVL